MFISSDFHTHAILPATVNLICNSNIPNLHQTSPLYPLICPMLPRLSRLATRRLREFSPSDATHELLTTAGFVSHPSAGLAHVLPLGLRIQRKIENIVRQELDAIGCGEISLSNLSSADLWKKTGRYDNAELFKLGDMLLAPTHEEEVTQLVGGVISSPRDLPVLFYQIGRKYRDEARPRSGLLRGKEFTMKDLYSFDKDEISALDNYSQVRSAYDRIFERLGIPVASVFADSGAIGGSHSHEYHVVHASGEDTLVTCSKCDYAANIEVAESAAAGKSQDTTVTTVDGVAVTHPTSHSVNPRLVKQVLSKQEAGGEQTTALTDASPHNLTTPIPGDSCAICSSPLEFSNAIEVGHTFYLGQKYSKPLNATFKNSENKETPVYMGCYGIGITRLIAAVAEVSRDEHGLRWPAQIAPFEHVIIGDEKVVKEKSAELQPYLHDAVLDDRPKKSIGWKIKEAQLMGFPKVVVVKKDKIEVIER